MNDQLKIYQDFIDELTELKEGVMSKWILEQGFPTLKENTEINDLLSRLSKHDKEIISRIVSDCRKGAIHDTLVYLQDSINSKDLRIFRKETEMANEPYGTSMYWDYIARSEGDEWPTDQLEERYK